VREHGRCVDADEITSLALSPLIMLHLLRRRMRGLERGIGPRLGLPTHGDFRPQQRDQRPVWLHGSSVGESMSALSLVRLLAERSPSIDFLITSGTVDGVDVVRQRLGCVGHSPSGFVACGNGSVASVTCVQAPADLPFAVWAFRRRWQPSALIVLEADLWPSMLVQCSRSGIPLALVDGRMSERSAGWWRSWLLRPLISFLLTRFNLVLCQSTADESRLRALGASTARCIGSVKGSADPLPVNSATVKTVREALRNRRVWVAASTHDKEEAMVAIAHQLVVAASKATHEREESENLCVGSDGLTRNRHEYEYGERCSGEARQRGLAPLLVLIPRHPRRCAQVVEILAKQHPDWNIVLYSEMPGQAYSSVATAEVLVIDALGVMGEWYTIADVALVGGSLVDGIGGHNVMEPALLACVPIIGPFNQNGQHLIDGLREIDDSCIRQVATSAELAAAVLSVLQSAHQDGANTHSSLQNTVRLAAEQLAQRTRMRIVDVVHLTVLPNKPISPNKP